MNVHTPYTQAGRMIGVSTRLGEDAFLLEHLAVDEAINALFEIRASVKSRRDDLKAEDLVGSAVDLALQLRDGGTRWWNGFVTGLHEGPLTTLGTQSDGAILLQGKEIYIVGNSHIQMLTPMLDHN